MFTPSSPVTSQPKNNDHSSLTKDTLQTKLNIFMVVSHNISRTFIKATNTLIDILSNKKTVPDCICWQETHAKKNAKNLANEKLLNHYLFIHCLLPESKAFKKAKKEFFLHQTK
jgi:hypothetical protein